MPHRKLAAEALAEVFNALAHPERLRIVEELGGGELDVASLQERLNLGQARVSRHLAVLRAARLVVSRPEGRHVWYRISTPGLSTWAAEGLAFVGQSTEALAQLREAASLAAQDWLGSGKASTKGRALPKA